MKTIRGRLAALLSAAVLSVAAAGQEPVPPPQEPASQPTGSVLEYVERLPEAEARALVFQNREVATLRAKILGRTPAERVQLAISRLNRAIELGGAHEFDMARVETAMVIRLDGDPIIAIAPEDLEPLSTASVTETAEQALGRLRLAFAEAKELRIPGILLMAAARAGAATLAFLLVLWTLMRLHGRLQRPLVRVASERLAGSQAGWGVLGAELSLERFARRVVLFTLGVLSLVATYLWLAYALRQFPYTRPWGEALGESLLHLMFWIGRAIIDAMPGMVTVLVVVVLTRIAARLVRRFFDAVADRRISIPGFDPEASRPTRKIVVGVLWVFAVVFAYPFLPGAGTTAFQGISVLLGVMVSLGSTGLVSQAMNGLLLMYSSSLRPGEFVKIGEVEGTVMNLGVLSTQIRTLTRELVTVPNSVVVQRETVNYSRLVGDGSAIRTRLTLGYDVPWRQIRAILLRAAAETEGVRTKPDPLVLQVALSDFYVEYELIVYVDEPRARRQILSDLLARILDLANEHGVQITSPHYVADRAAPIVVPRERWFAPPAVEEQGEDAADSGQG